MVRCTARIYLYATRRLRNIYLVHQIYHHFWWRCPLCDTRLTVDCSCLFMLFNIVGESVGCTVETCQDPHGKNNPICLPRADHHSTLYPMLSTTCSHGGTTTCHLYLRCTVSALCHHTGPCGPARLCGAADLCNAGSLRAEKDELHGHAENTAPYV